MPTLLEALKRKYCSDCEFESDDACPKETTTPQMSAGSMNAAASAAESTRVSIYIPKLSPLLLVPELLVLNDCDIDSAGDFEGIREKCERVRELDLAQNKLQDWQEVFHILKHMPRIKFLNLSKNQLCSPLLPSSTNMRPYIGNLRSIVLNGTYLEWLCVQELLENLPVLEELHLSLNNYRDVLIDSEISNNHNNDNDNDNDDANTNINTNTTQCDVHGDNMAATSPNDVAINDNNADDADTNDDHHANKSISNNNNNHHNNLNNHQQNQNNQINNNQNNNNNNNNTNNNANTNINNNYGASPRSPRKQMKAHTALKTLHFTGNPIESWCEICRLGRVFPNLENLVLAECPIKSINTVEKDVNNQEQQSQQQQQQQQPSTSSPASAATAPTPPASVLPPPPPQQHQQQQQQQQQPQPLQEQQNQHQQQQKQPLPQQSQGQPQQQQGKPSSMKKTMKSMTNNTVTAIKLPDVQTTAKATATTEEAKQSATIKRSRNVILADQNYVNDDDDIINVTASTDAHAHLDDNTHNNHDNDNDDDDDDDNSRNHVHDDGNYDNDDDDDVADDDNDEPTDPPYKYFEHLLFLNLSWANINTWDDIDRLARFPQLRHVRVKNWPLWERLECTEHERRQLLIARLPNVHILNGGGTITADEREDAERAFIRYYMERPIADRPQRYHELIDRHGQLDPLVNVSLKPETRVHVLLTFDGQSEMRLVDIHRTVADLKLRLEKIIQLPANKMRLFYVDQDYKEFGPEEMKYPNKLLYSYNIQAGDEIIVDQKK